METDTLLVDLAMAYMQSKHALYKKAADEIIRLRGLVGKENIDLAIPFRASAKTILDVVLHHYGISEVDFMSLRRNSRFVAARQDFILLARELTLLSGPEIARKMNKNHTAVTYYEKRGKKMLFCVPEYKKVLELLRSKVVNEEIERTKANGN